MRLTEIVNPISSKDNPKALVNTTVERQCRSFKSLRKVASFSRKHFHFVHTQKTTEKAPRQSNICTKLHIGSHLLWIDLDTNVDSEDLRKRFKKSGLKGFFYFTSAFYSRGESRVRICVVTRELVPIDYQAKYYARQLLAKLGYDDDFISHLDTKVYNPTGYFAPVMYSDGRLVTNYDEKGKSLFIFSNGKLFRWIAQKDFQENLKRTQNPRRLKTRAQFGPLGDFARKLSSFDNVETALDRSNGTVTIEFKNIAERTKGGYYLNPKVDPWIVFHPNKEKKPFYINTKLTKKDFAKYKKYVLRRFRPPDVLKSIRKANKLIVTKKKYLSQKTFNDDHSLLLVESPTGSGKTTALARWMKRFEGSVLFISVNRAQAVTTHRSLLKRGLSDFRCYIASHQDQQSTIVNRRAYESDFIAEIREGFAPERLICGVLSLHHLIGENDELLRTYDLVVIDEITTLPHFAVSPVDLIAEEYIRFQRDMLALTRLLRMAKKVIGMDGYISKPAMDAIASISQKKPYLIRKKLKTDKKVEIYLTSKGNEPDFKRKITCKRFMAQLRKDLLKANQNKKLIVIAFSYKKKAQEMAEYIKQTIPNSKNKIRLVTGDTTENEETLNTIRKLYHDLEKKNTCFLIYSPAITTGVDISQAQNTNVYHVISGIHLTSHTHYQMTMRGRKAASYKVLFPLFLAKNTNSKLPSHKEAENMFNHRMTRLFETVTFRGRYNTKLLKAAVKDKNLKMAGLLLFKYLEGVTFIDGFEYKQIPKTMVLKKLRNNALFSIITSEDVKTAIKLELACTEWDLYDRSYGTLGQYVNLLAREGCLVSKQLDKTKAKLKKYKKNDQQYAKDTLNTINNTLNYHGNLNYNSSAGLYKTMNRIKASQRVMDYLLNKNEYHSETVNTANILRRLFSTYNINFEINFSEKLSNVKLIEMYESLVTRVYSSQVGIEAEVERLIRAGMSVSKVSKLRRMTSILRLFFSAQRKSRKDKQLTVKPNHHLLRSLEGIGNDHRKCLVKQGYKK